MLSKILHISYYFFKTENQNNQRREVENTVCGKECFFRQFIQKVEPCIAVKWMFWPFLYAAVNEQKLARGRKCGHLHAGHLDSFKDAHAKNLLTQRSSETNPVNRSIRHPQLHLLCHCKGILASTCFLVQKHTSQIWTSGRSAQHYFYQGLCFTPINLLNVKIWGRENVLNL